jgi:hypothetical protein
MGRFTVSVFFLIRHGKAGIHILSLGTSISNLPNMRAYSVPTALSRRIATVATCDSPDKISQGESDTQNSTIVDSAFESPFEEPIVHGEVDSGR